MSTPGFWKVLEEFSLRFKSRLELPFSVSVLQQKIQIRQLSPKSKLKLKISFFILLTHTIYCFLALCWFWTRKSSISDELLGHLRIFLILAKFNAPACVLSMHFVISFRPQLFPAILNPMTRFQGMVASKEEI